MADVDWYYAPTGPGQIADIVSHQPGIRGVMMYHAMGMAREALFHLSAHRDKGHTQIYVVGAPPTKLDWYVVMDHEQNMAAAAAIEWGFTDKHGKHHEGLHILGDVMRNATRGFGR